MVQNPAQNSAQNRGENPAQIPAQRGASEVLILDEIDSNLSGKEAASVAQVLLELAQNYQIIAISHQLQLSVLATHHFVVERGADGASSVRKITRQERIDEISRMISGASVTPQTRAYAEELLAQTPSRATQGRGRAGE